MWLSDSTLAACAHTPHMPWARMHAFACGAHVGCQFRMAAATVIASLTSWCSVAFPLHDTPTRGHARRLFNSNMAYESWPLGEPLNEKLVQNILQKLRRT